MKLLDYINKSKRTINTELSQKEATLHAVHGMWGEFGEMNSIFQKTFQNHPFDKAHLLSETGDLMWFCAEYINVNDINIDDLKIAPRPYAPKEVLPNMYAIANVLADITLYEATAHLELVVKNGFIGKLINAVMEFCLTVDIDFDEVLEHNYEKLLKRYPEGFETERSLHRAEGDI